ncbi:MAG: sulfite exporter TauE/SafE family protein [Anaerolineaceae bacterium]|nr:sulfite exporter TauE/SafE family protein [Anaerolineaceae bacterium]
MIVDFESALLVGLFFLAAVLYSSVGHAGASGYLAVMALVGIAPSIMKPTALALNILVAIIVLVKFYRVGSFSWRIFIPLVITSIPLAYLGGRLLLPEQYYKPLVGFILLFAAWRLIMTARNGSDYEIQKPSIPVLVIMGAVLGLLSGLTGVGGGIFLSPILVFFRWAPIKVISGVAAGFILVNSVSGIFGVLSTNIQFHPNLPILVIVVIIGGFIGAEYGSKHLGNKTIQRLLALVLIIAGIKMILMI